MDHAIAGSRARGPDDRRTRFGRSTCCRRWRRSPACRCARVDGESLVPLFAGQSRREPPPSYAETYYPKWHFGWSELKSVRAGNWKYIDAPEPELYDMRADAAERRNAVDARGTLATGLSAELTQDRGRLRRRGNHRRAAAGCRNPRAPAQSRLCRDGGAADVRCARAGSKDMMRESRDVPRRDQPCDGRAGAQ